MISCQGLDESALRKGYYVTRFLVNLLRLLDNVTDGHEKHANEKIRIRPLFVQFSLSSIDYINLLLKKSSFTIDVVV